jgi:hypothetical protein
MPIVEGSVTINAPADGLFKLSQDYTLRRSWDLFVREMRFCGGATEAGKGVRIWVRAWTGLTMEVEFTSFRSPKSVAMKMVPGPWFLRQFAGTWLFLPKKDGRTTVTFRYYFAARGHCLACFLEPIIAWVFSITIFVSSCFSRMLRFPLDCAE